MTRERLLHDPTTGKIWGTRCEGAIVEVTSGNAAKPKVQPKEFPGPDEAVAWAVKQEWSRLKKGFVLVNPAAEAGQPSMQRYIGGGYTGALMIAGCAGRVVTNRHQDEDASGQQPTCWCSLVTMPGHSMSGAPAKPILHGQHSLRMTAPAS